MQLAEVGRAEETQERCVTRMLALGQAKFERLVRHPQGGVASTVRYESDVLGRVWEMWILEASGDGCSRLENIQHFATLTGCQVIF